MGILANHVPSVEPLRPGVIEVIESGGASKKWFGTWGIHAIFFKIETYHLNELQLAVDSLPSTPAAF